MIISKELIEKYHDGACTPEEKIAVENWLFSEASEEELLLPSKKDKLSIQNEMWADISSILPNKVEKPNVFVSNKLLGPNWQLAASILLAAMLGSVLFLFKFSRETSNIIVLNNTSETINKNLNERGYTISIGPKSNVEINNQTGIIDFCGAMMINPKQDMTFTIQGTCMNDAAKSEKMTLKKGLNYIALNYSSPTQANEVIVLEEGSMMGLPPLVMKQLIHQFKI